MSLYTVSMTGDMALLYSDIVLLSLDLFTLFFVDVFPNDVAVSDSFVDNLFYLSKDSPNTYFALMYMYIVLVYKYIVRNAGEFFENYMNLLINSM
ncbi:hypothetical protein [Sphingobacterium sp. LRF_L2]|uniref:hypothetical protein n=1 Tax=Sphingobacterium sp. LRF_L2 TaxID=3369421 RepID=UPI003F5FA1EF